MRRMLEHRQLLAQCLARRRRWRRISGLRRKDKTGQTQEISDEEWCQQWVYIVASSAARQWTKVVVLHRAHRLARSHVMLLPILPYLQL